MKIVLGIVGIIVVVGILITIGQSGQTVEPVATNQDFELQNDVLEDPVTQPTQTIVDVAVATNELSTLVTAVSAAGLVDTLNSDGPFTVFAPTNDAFAALPPETLQSLLQPENVETLTQILTTHVVAGVILAADLEDGMVLTTVSGTELPVQVAADGTVTIAGSTVIAADVNADNGVVHVIDTVIVDA